MPHSARARPAALVRGHGSQRPQLTKPFSPHVKPRISERTRPACSLITTPVLTELVKLTLSTSSVTNTNTIAAGMSAHVVSWKQYADHTSYYIGCMCPAVSQAVGPNCLVWYSILCALTASLGTWVVHLTSYLWHNLFEAYVVQERSTHPKVMPCLTAAYNHTFTRRFRCRCICISYCHCVDGICGDNQTHLMGEL